MASAVPATALPAFAAESVVSATFDSGKGTWDIYKESGGDCALTVQDGKLALNIKATGKKTYSVQMFYPLIPLYENAKYVLSYDISCTTDRFVEGMIQQNGGDYTAYVWDGIDVTSTPQTITHEFTMEYANDPMAKLVFNCGLQEKDGGELPEHTIYLDNVKLELVDDSGANKSFSDTAEAPILTNQVGYETNAKKIAVFRGVTNQTEFTVMDAASKQTVYTGKLSAKMSNSSAGEDNW
jgi:endoglucanase